MRRAARAGRSVLADEAERVIDGMMAGPLPDVVARSAAEHEVIDRVVAEVLESPTLARWLESDEAMRLVEPAAERVLRSPAFRDAVFEIVASPELRRALTQQTSGFGADLAASVRRRAERGDAESERRVHRLFRLAYPSPLHRTNAGFATRGMALVVDAVLVQLLFLIATGSIAVVMSLVGSPFSGWSGRGAVTAAWLLVTSAYFVGFWNVGQTPGMRLMRLRVVTLDGRNLSPLRALLRFFGLLVAIVPACAGLALVLVDGRRRALQDMLARTVVLYDRGLDAPVDPVRAVVARDGDGPAPAARLRHTTTEVDGVHMHAVVGGRGAPVVLVHGFGVSGTYMLPLARVLATSCRVYVPDLPGQGRSGAPSGEWGIGEMANALGRWLEETEVQRPVVVANSLGCQVVTELAVREPRALGPLVLVGPTMDPERRDARRQAFSVMRDSVREPASLLALAARGNARTDIRPLLAAARAALGDRIEERLPSIAQPTVVVYGEDDGFVGRPWMDRVVELMPDARLVAVPREPHAVHYTRPALVAEVVLDLLRPAPVALAV
jgi:2-hydroxy-6-oxonona-2,4-dienedioate hydrolase